MVQELANTQGAPSERSHMHGSPKWRRGIPEKNLRMKAQKNSIMQQRNSLKINLSRKMMMKRLVAPDDVVRTIFSRHRLHDSSS